jgi:hypothetical protein
MPVGTTMTMTTMVENSLRVPLFVLGFDHSIRFRFAPNLFASYLRGHWSMEHRSHLGNLTDMQKNMFAILAWRQGSRGCSTQREPRLNFLAC